MAMRIDAILFDLGGVMIDRFAKGENPDNGGADMIYYEMPSGGKVFSAGSIAWNASIFIDDKVSKITRNVIENFLK